MSVLSSSVPSYPFARTIVAFTIWPRTGSGTPVTAHSSTAGCFIKTLSTSNGPMRYPLDFINNATIILDYVDFEAGNELVFLYNRVRNEFYAENKKRFIPNTMHEFDAKTLEDLEVLLAERLEPYLLELDTVHQ